MKSVQAGSGVRARMDFTGELSRIRGNEWTWISQDFEKAKDTVNFNLFFLPTYVCIFTDSKKIIREKSQRDCRSFQRVDRSSGPWVRL